MAMTPTDDGSAMNPEPAESPQVRAAKESLRQHVDQRWVEMSESILARVLARTGPSQPVVGDAPGGTFHVSEAVLRRQLLDAVDSVSAVVVDAIDIHTEENRYSAVTVVITAQHGLALLRAADEIRQRCQQRLIAVLGEAVPVDVTTMRVHVEDVTREDPTQR